MEDFSQTLQDAVNVVKKGGIILYPTDTVWGIGCDATNKEAIARIYKIKHRDDSKSMLILLPDERSVLRYVAGPDPAVFDLIGKSDRPTTVIYENAINLPENLINQDGSIGIRLVKEPFCLALLKRLGKPIVSTSANISGQPSARFFDEVSAEIKKQMDYMVTYRRNDKTPSKPSKIIKLERDGSIKIIRA